ncbi:GNAT family N-acetyltransferase [Enterovibrio nigricans]|uniref:Putative acetyltransferase n=1 Tax=Enterovibrio nigricans DSM 22720 TaxID=1121868 RepID=A0A1T4TSH4_9GAMM|nr:N-acetyltransferase [Enterovibrio nigricans]SKA43382.1 putative acetyltransferase [Enterovibrio nigricans DSM 22720]
MLIRSEAPADLLAIDRLLKKTFPTNAEAKLVMTLRENGHNTLSLVACDDDGALLGHVMFSPVMVGGQDIGVQGLAPVSVHPDFRNQGIAVQLVREGFEILAEFGYPACVVLGDPNYYSRFAFQPASSFNLHCKWDVPAGAFMGIELQEGVFRDCEGLVEYSFEFDEL